ncbi:MAG: hypothetical protein ACYTA3_05630 [Planctomycetota bacterium]|jgi:hypothetical protein
MTDLLTKLKPGVSRQARLFLAAAAWTAVGLGLLIAGTRWSLWSDSSLHPTFLVLAAAVGLTKAFVILKHTANRVIGRIQASGDDRCIGGFFSWRTWVLVAIMITAGTLLRRSDISRGVIGLVYVAIGIALLAASTLPWRAWYRNLDRTPAGNSANPS